MDLFITWSPTPEVPEVAHSLWEKCLGLSSFLNLCLSPRFPNADARGVYLARFSRSLFYAGLEITGLAKVEWKFFIDRSQFQDRIRARRMARAGAQTNKAYSRQYVKRLIIDANFPDMVDKAFTFCRKRPECELHCVFFWILELRLIAYPQSIE